MGHIRSAFTPLAPGRPSDKPAGTNNSASLGGVPM